MPKSMIVIVLIIYSKLCFSVEGESKNILFSSAWNNELHFINSEMDVYLKDSLDGIKMAIIIGKNRNNIGIIRIKDSKLNEFYVAGDNKLPISVKGPQITIVGLKYNLDIKAEEKALIFSESFNEDLIFVPDKK